MYTVQLVQVVASAINMKVKDAHENSNSALPLSTNGLKTIYLKVKCVIIGKQY